MTNPKASWLAAARAAMEIESAAVLSASTRLNDKLLEAVDLILAGSGKVVVTGVGKSGAIGKKIASTLVSTGTKAVFLHPGEAAHGDLGIYSQGDPTLMISNSGTTSELMLLLGPLRDLESRTIGILGNAASPLAGKLDVVLDATVDREADPHNLVPTASSIVALSLGHALAVALMTARGFTAEDYAGFHPGGQLGRSLRMSVQDVLHGCDEIALVKPNDSLKQVVIAMTSYPLGAACVVDETGRLQGLITDGDLRRALRDCEDIRTLAAKEVMTANPVTIHPDARLVEALSLMEDRPSQIQVVPVIELDTAHCLGLVRLHDICQAWLPRPA